MCARHVLFLGAILWLEPTLDVCCRYVKGVSLATYFRELRKCADGPGGRYKILGLPKSAASRFSRLALATTSFYSEHYTKHAIKQQQGTVKSHLRTFSGLSVMKEMHFGAILMQHEAAIPFFCFQWMTNKQLFEGKNCLFTSFCQSAHIHIGSIVNEGKPLCIKHASFCYIRVDWMLYRGWSCCMAMDGHT